MDGDDARRFNTPRMAFDQNRSVPPVTSILDNVVDAQARHHLHSLELKLQQLQQSQLSQMAVNDLMKTISARSAESVRQSEECEQCFKEAMQKFCSFDERIVALETYVKREADRADRESAALVSKINFATLELETQMVHLGEVRQALMEEKAERTKADSAVYAQVQDMNDLLERIGHSQAALGDEIPRIAKTFMGYQECTAKKIAGLQRDMTNAEDAALVSQNKYAEQIKANSEVVNRLSAVCNSQIKQMEKLNSLNSRLDGVNEVWDARSEKIFQQIAVVQDDVETVHDDTKRQVSVATESVKTSEKHLRVELDQRMMRIHEISEDRFARHTSIVDDKLEVLKAAVDGKFETTNEMVERRSTYMNEVMAKILTEGEGVRSQMDSVKQEMMDRLNIEFQRMRSDALSNNVTHTSQLKQVGEMADDQVETFLQAVDTLDKKVSKECTVILEKAKLGAMDVADLRAMQSDKKMAHDTDVLVYWLQMCCDKLHLRPKGLLALPKRSSSVDRRRTTCWAESPRRTTSHIADSPRCSLRVGESPRRSSVPNGHSTPVWGSKYRDDSPLTGVKTRNGKDENTDTLRGSMMKGVGKSKVKPNARRSVIKSFVSANPLLA